MKRSTIATLAASASVLVGIAGYEGYRDRAYTPVKGDVPTIGFGTTSGVKLGDRIEPVTALKRLHSDMQKFEGAIKQCVKVPLYQHEYDAYLSLSYNIGSNAFCGSTLVKKLNAGDYQGACEQILRWDKFQGRTLRGLTIRRRAEYQQCLGLGE
ncbi:lysozyme [Oligella urethralis]|uniref:Lysozyme n=1 Tax=Oligella urethralis DNF00040 TaxID=1401065 RepID=A0A096BBC6_9BURK|nr:lysozyme [Oligella urethralis]KGF30479.1 glycoside hydrolase family 24 [Oligella urethralis DNF00040]